MYMYVSLSLSLSLCIHVYVTPYLHPKTTLKQPEPTSPSGRRGWQARSSSAALQSTLPGAELA